MRDAITIFVFVFGIVITGVCLYYEVPRVFPILATLLAISVLLYRFFDAVAKAGDKIKITGAGGVMVGLFLVFFAFSKDKMEAPFELGDRSERNIELPIVLKHARNLSINDSCVEIYKNQDRVMKTKDNYIIKFGEKETPSISISSIPDCNAAKSTTVFTAPIAIEFTLQRPSDPSSPEAQLRTLFITINQKMWQATATQ